MANANTQGPSKGPDESQELHEFTALRFNGLVEKKKKKRQREITHTHTHINDKKKRIQKAYGAQC